ncbi:MAG: hypothetical protein ACRCZI_12215 [Cetobacterium sp.]
MPVTEAHRALGDWSLALHPDTPKAIRDAVTFCGHVVIVPQWIPPETASDSAILGLARYTGVLLRGPGTFELGGHGLAWWMGDADGNGAVLASPVTNTAANLSTWVTSLRPAALVAGTVTSPAGTPTATFHRVSRRQALDAICDAVGAVWRVRPNFALDAGTQANVFGAAPTAIAVPHEGADDLHVRGFEGDLGLVTDFSEHTTQLVLLAAGGVGTSGGASATFRDGQGNLVTLTRVAEAPDVPPGSEATAASNLLNIWSSTSGRRSVSLSSARYDLAGIVTPGALIWAYDPSLGLVDLTNQRYHAGQPVWPVALTVQSVSWPIEEGMGVFYRHRTASATTYTDLTPYVVFESAGAQVQVGGLARPDLGIGERPSSVSIATVEAAGWVGYTPTWGSGGAVGNGSLSGAWRREGTTLHIRGQLVAGSTTTYGGAGWSMSLPSGMTAVSGPEQIISATAVDSGTQRFRGIGIVTSGATTVLFQCSDGASLVGNVVPHTWATGDSLAWTGTIEVQ